jgi:hypothetical protein
MKRSEIEALDSGGEIETKKDGKMRRVRRYQNLATGQCFEIDDSDGTYRKSAIPPSRNQLAALETTWRKLDPET